MHWLESSVALLALGERLGSAANVCKSASVPCVASGATSPQQSPTTVREAQRDAAGRHDWQARQRAPNLSGFVVNFAAFCRISPHFA